MTIPELATAQYVALETFRKNGEGVITPTWIAADEDHLYIWTDADSWKVKRIRATPGVRLCASNAMGKPLSNWIHATARILGQPEDIAEMEVRLLKKYGLIFRFFRIAGKLRGQGGPAVIQLSPDPTDA